MLDIDSPLSFRVQLSQEDIERAHAAIATHEAACTELASEIHAAQLVVASIVARKAKHEAAIKRYKALITLATHLPPEVLALIFAYCAGPSWPRAPIVLSHVCANWRRAVPPSAWRYVYINFDAPAVLDRTRLWLTNAQSAPLELVLNLWTEHTSWRMFDVLELLHEHVAQWEAFSVRGDYIAPIMAVLGQCTGVKFPLLKRVDVYTEDFVGTFRSDAWLDSLRTGFADAALWDTLNLSSYFVPRPGLIPTQIVNLTLQFMPIDSDPSPPLSADAFLELLGSLPELRTLEISLCFNGARAFLNLPSPDAPPVDLERLKSFTVTATPNIVTSLLDIVVAPSLRRLRLRSSEEPASFPDPAVGLALESFLERSDCPPIAQFVMHDIDIPEGMWPPVLAALPSLEELFLHESEVGDAALLHALARDETCPRLRALDLRWCGQLTGGALVSLVRLRGLERVTVIHCSFVDDTDIIELARLTLCSVYMRVGDEDYELCCRHKKCCYNDQYRRRLRMRYLMKTSAEERKWMRLVVD